MNMLLIFGISVCLLAVSEGVGQMLLHMLNLQTDDFAAPIGTAVLFALLQVLYTPVIVSGGSYGKAVLMTVGVLLVACVCLVCTFHSCFRSLFRGRSIYVLAGGLILIAIFSCCSDKLDPSLNHELSIFQMNLHAAHISLPLNPMQGYPLLGSFVLSFQKGTPYGAALLLGIYANMVTTMLLLDIVDSFRIGNPWFRLTLILGSIFYYQFYSWKIIDAFQGGNWRIFFTALLLYFMYQWIKTKEDRLKYVCVFVIGAGFLVSRGYLLISIEIIYCIGTWMLATKKIRSLYDITTFLIPIFFYLCTCAMLWKVSVGFLLLLGLLAVTLMRHRKKIYHHMILLENALMDHCRLIFFGLVPGIFLAGTFILRFFVKGYGFAYSAYLDYFSSSYLKSYLFMNHSVSDYVLDLWRWSGLLVFVLRAKREEDRMIRTVFSAMVFFFLNPLCMGLLSRITGYDMYAYAFEILLNPFTDVMIFYWIYTQFEWTVLGQWVLELTLVGAVLFGHIAGFIGIRGSLYGDLLDENRITEVRIP